MAAYYFGKGEPSPHPNMLALATSACRPPLVVADIALDREGRGTYVYQSRPPGLNLMPRPAEAPPAFPAYQVTIRKGHRSLTLDFSSGK
ncbi:MAG: hypothetical protein EHM17_02090 [Verrucomicrobiaceae bacterium]|nr:MAG: hypothetical protein EHM17_02090 [Verrucomicrobiaceae bacterium]